MATRQQIAAKLTALLNKAQPKVRLNAGKLKIKGGGEERTVNLQPFTTSDRGVQSR